MSLLSHAEYELDLIGMKDGSDDDMNIAMRKHILHMIEEFSEEGHSGFSAQYAISILSKLLKYEPLTPLTGDDSEWVDVSEMNGNTLYQNKRSGRVFKDNDGAYDIEGKVYWDWFTDEETGEKYKSYYTGRESRVPVEFPYVPTTVYEETPPEQK
jgi:hypothetical protein